MSHYTISEEQRELYRQREQHNEIIDALEQNGEIDTSSTNGDYIMSRVKSLQDKS
jgi:Asp-tRNA(Asn)/Glu-tRNA(Gln) amidotransferase C subunit